MQLVSLITNPLWSHKWDYFKDHDDTNQICYMRSSRSAVQGSRTHRRTSSSEKITNKSDRHIVSSWNWFDLIGSSLDIHWWAIDSKEGKRKQKISKTIGPRTWELVSRLLIVSKSSSWTIKTYSNKSIALLSVFPHKFDCLRLFSLQFCYRLINFSLYINESYV